MTYTRDAAQFTAAAHQSSLREAVRALEDRLSAPRRDHDAAAFARRSLVLARERLASPDLSYLEARRSLVRRNAALDRLHNHFSPEGLTEARRALAKGDEEAAAALFADLEAQQRPAIERAADAAHQQALAALAALRLQEAEAHIERAIRFAPDRYAPLRDGGEIAAACSDETTALARRRRALEAAEAEHGVVSVETAEAAGRLAESLQLQGDLVGAEALCRRALAIDEALLGRDRPDVAGRLAALSNVLRDQRRWDEAQAALERALEIGRGSLGESHPEYGVWLGALAGLRRSQGRLEEAAELLERAVEIAREASGPWHPTLALRLNNLAGLRRAQGRLEEAERLYKQAIAIDGETLGRDHPGYAIDLVNLAALYEQTGVDEEAEDLYGSAEAILRAAHGRAHDLTRLAAEGRARAARRRRRVEASDTTPHDRLSPVQRPRFA